jgi:hypothetical protein
MIEDDPHLERQPQLLEELRTRFAGAIEWLFRS